MKPTSLKPLLTLILALLFLGAASLPALELSGRKVVIDPGHGGSDPGATGYDGPGKPNEADFNLAVSLDHLRQPKVAAQHYRLALEATQRRPAGFDRERARLRLAELGREY